MSKGSPKYYLIYSTERYEGPSVEEFPIDSDGRKKLNDFLNQYASNPDFKFTLIYGQQVEVEPVDIVKQFRIKD